MSIGNLNAVGQNAYRTEFKIVDQLMKFCWSVLQAKIVPKARGETGGQARLLRIQFPRVKIDAHGSILLLV